MSAPRYVRACYEQKNYLAVWRAVEAASLPANGLPVIRIPHRCGSWRHGGPCARHAGARDFARIKAALEGEDPESIVYLVVTLDRHRRELAGTRWEMFRQLSPMTRRLQKRLNRLATRDGGDPIGCRWVSVTEQHRDGWPHVNIVCVSRWLADRVRAMRAANLAAGVHENNADVLGGELQAHVEAAGFARTTATTARSTKVLAGYLVKLARAVESPVAELGVDARAVAEVAKIAQSPTAAPRGFRRLRSGVRFLPPRHRGSGRWTGTLAAWKTHQPIGRRRKTAGVATDSTAPEVAIDLRAGRIYRTDRVPLMIGHEAPTRKYTLKQTPRDGTPAALRSGGEQAPAEVHRRALLGTGTVLARWRAIQQRLHWGPVPPRAPTEEPTERPT